MSAHTPTIKSKHSTLLCTSHLLMDKISRKFIHDITSKYIIERYNVNFLIISNKKYYLFPGVLNVGKHYIFFIII
jgi:hypothetical protein